MVAHPNPKAALIILCQANGTIVEILHDDFDLKADKTLPGSFASMVTGASASKAGRFLRTAAAHRPALDWQMDTLLPQGTAPLFFTGIPAGRGILIVGAKEPLCTPVKASPAERDAASMPEMTAHDLRNPVSGILAASEFLMEDIKTGLEEHHLNLLRSIQASSRLVLRLIDKMLEAPGGDAGRSGTHLQPTDLTPLLNRCAALNRPLAECRNIRIEVNAVKPVPALEIDSRKVAQAINALLKNEIKCSRPGSRIEILIDADDADATITVRDQGPGISAADLRTLFDPLRSGRPKRGLMEARTALTLATVKRIVEGQGGAIRVESAVRKGSTFTLALPLPDAAGSRSRRIDRRIAIG